MGVGSALPTRTRRLVGEVHCWFFPGGDLLAAANQYSGTTQYLFPKPPIHELERPPLRRKNGGGGGTRLTGAGQMRFLSRFATDDIVAGRVIKNPHSGKVLFGL